MGVSPKLLPMLAWLLKKKVPRFCGCIKIRTAMVPLNVLQKYCQFGIIPVFIPFPHSLKRKGKKPSECPKIC